MSERIPRVGCGEGRLILRVLSGSRAHGLARAESDTDTRGVCIPAPRFFVGLSKFEQYESEGGDHVVYALSKFAKLALQGNPNIIETLYTEVDSVLTVDPTFGQPLVEARDAFLSQRVGESFMRYGLAQLKRLSRHHRWIREQPPIAPEPEEFGAVQKDGRYQFPSADAERGYRAAMKHHEGYRDWQENRNPERRKLEEAYGYDTKHAVHLCRLLKMGGEILDEGRVLVRRPDADWLRAIREGGLSYPELMQWAESRVSALPELMARSELPTEPDQARIESLVVDLHRRFLEETA